MRKRDPRTHGELLSGDLGNVHVVSGGREILVLSSSEDVDTDKVDLGVSVLSSLGSGHIDDLAGESLDDDKTVLSQRRALSGECLGGSRGDLREFFVGHL